MMTLYDSLCLFLCRVYLCSCACTSMCMCVHVSLPTTTPPSGITFMTCFHHYGTVLEYVNKVATNENL